MIEDEERSERNTKTVSPPAIYRERGISVELSSTRKNFHERNLEHLKTLTNNNFKRIQEIEDEKRKLEITRQRLAQRVLKRNAESKLKEQFPAEPIIEEEKSNKIDHKSRNKNYIQNLQESNKAKQQLKEEQEEKKLQSMKKLRENLGFGNVQAKVTESEEKKISKPDPPKKKPPVKSKEEEKISLRPRREEEQDSKKQKKSDEQTFQRLTQMPKRFSGVPIVTDMSVFKKKNGLTDIDKIFIINGCYPDIRKALIKRSTCYIGRLV